MPKTPQNKVIILGCGNSAGTPAPSLIPGGDWGACDPNTPENYRTRPSIYVEYEGQRILVDPSPDFRQQYLRNNLTGLNVVILTHAHADHIAGIDDLRQIYFSQNRQPLPIYATSKTFQEVKGTFSYLFQQHEKIAIYPKVLEENVVEDDFDISGHPIQITHQPHGAITSLGLRFGSFAYSTDFQELSDPLLERLREIDLWVVDCAHANKAPPTHSHLKQTLTYIEKVKPKKAILTHMSRTIDYTEIKQYLPPSVEPAFDGMVLEF